MNNKDIDYIIKTAFAHEIENILEKNAQVGVLANLIKFIKPVAQAIKNLGTSGKFLSFLEGAEGALKAGGTAGQLARKSLADYLVQYRTPMIKSLGNGSVALEEIAVPANSGWLARGIGNAVYSARRLREGIGAGKSFSENVIQGIKNFFDLTKDQIRTERFKVIPGKGTRMINPVNDIYRAPDGKLYLRSKASFLKDRPIAGMQLSPDNKEVINYIVKKRLPMQVLGASITPAAFGAQSLLFGGDNRVKEGITDYATWQFARPYTEAKLGYNMIKGLFNKNTNKNLEGI